MGLARQEADAKLLGCCSHKMVSRQALQEKERQARCSIQKATNAKETKPSNAAVQATKKGLFLMRVSFKVFHTVQHKLKTSH